MATKLNRMYVGAIVNRDLELFEKIRKFCKSHYNIKIVNLFKKEKFSVKYFRKKLKKYDIKLLMVKLYSEESNKKIYDAIKEYAPDIPRLNSVKSVKICESRKSTFKLIENRCRKLTIPRSFYSLNSACKAIDEGVPLIIKLNTHNIPNFDKFDRIVGVASNREEFLKIIKEINIENNILFFQEYLGKFEDVYKVYVIDGYTQTIISKNLLQQDKLSQADLVHMRVEIPSKLKRQIKRLGKKFEMSLFGVDFVYKDDIPYIVDINDFPSFSSIPEAKSLIADHIYNVFNAQQQFEGKIPKSLKSKLHLA